MTGRVLVVDDSATVRKIVRLVLEDAGYSVVDSADGQQALDVIQRDAFDLMLIDFVMPRLNGYQLAQAVRSIAHLRTLPIILMSAKAEQIAERFMRSTGAIDAITKPFSPDALMAVVAHAMSNRNAAAPGPTLVRDEMHSQNSIVPPPPSDSFGSEHTSVDSLHAKTTSPDLNGILPKVLAQAAAAQRFAEMLARALAPSLDRAVRESRSMDERSIVEAITRAVGPSELAGLARELRSFDADLRGAVGIEGAVSLVPVGEIMQVLRLQRQTGVFVVQRKAAAVVVQIRDGAIDLALARGVSPEFLLGRYLLADRLINRDDLDLVLREREAEGGFLGEHLLRRGFISNEDLERALTRQTSEVIFELMRWPDGNYRFETGVILPEAQGARLGLPVESLVLEGFRRVDEWRVIEQEVSSFDEVLARDEAVIEAVGSARLAHDEQVVLDAVDGRRSVREVVGAAALSSFDGCRILYRLLRSRLLRKRSG